MSIFDVATLRALPKSALGKALVYAQNYKSTTYNVFLDGRLEIDNNESERKIKDIVIGRKNWLFSNTPKGARSSAIIYSIVETAKANGLIVEKYLTYLFDEVSKLEIKDMDILKKFMPWSTELPENLYSTQQK